MREGSETNLFGPLALASAFAGRIAERSGAVVNVSSLLAWWPLAPVAKAAVWSATDSMRLELASRGVQLMGVYVGVVDTGPKSSPADVGRQVLDGIESGDDEVLADDLTRQIRAQLGTLISAIADSAA